MNTLERVLDSCRICLWKKMTLFYYHCIQILVFKVDFGCKLKVYKKIILWIYGIIILTVGALVIFFRDKCSNLHSKYSKKIYTIHSSWTLTWKTFSIFQVLSIFRNIRNSYNANSIKLSILLWNFPLIRYVEKFNFNILMTKYSKSPNT